MWPVQNKEAINPGYRKYIKLKTYKDELLVLERKGQSVRPCQELR